MRTILIAILGLGLAGLVEARREVEVRYEPSHRLADAMGYMLTAVETQDNEIGSFPSENRENPPSVPGWPLSISNYPPDEGVLFVQADITPQLEILFLTNKTIHLMRADGTYVFGWPKIIVNGTATAGGPAFGDLNGDGYGEVVATSCNYPNGSQGWVHAYHASGVAVSGFPVTTNGDFTKSPTVVDLDDDGSCEIIVSERDWPIGRVYVFRGNGSLWEGWPVELDHVPAASAGAADLDGDGNKEILFESYEKVYAFALDGSLVPGFPFTPSTGDVFSYSAPTTADIDNDGLPEIAVGGHSMSGDSGVFLIDGDGAVMPGWPKLVPNWVYAPVTFVDLDSDEDLEIVVGDQVLSMTPTDYVFAWHADGSPVTGWPVGPMQAINAQVAAADIDGDTDPELVWDDNTSAGILNGYHHTGVAIDGL